MKGVCGREGGRARSAKDGTIEKITGRAGYGGVFALTGRGHLNVVRTAKSKGEGSRKRRAARSRLAGCGTL